MDVFLLVLIWILIGLVAGTLAHIARLGFAARHLGGQWAIAATLALGIGAALVGGGLGWVILGRFFATPTALWVATAAVALGPWAVAWARSRSTDAQEPRG